jgi:2-phosphoglycerate kinase
MKNLIILGVPRAGKSTLATNVAKKLSECGDPISLINADAVMGGLTAERGGHAMYRYIIRPLRHIIPGLRNHSKQQMRKNLVNFIGRFLDETAQTSTVIFEGAYISPEYATKIFNTKKFKIVVIGYPNISAEDKCKDIRKFDKKTPLNSLNDSELFNRISGLIKTSQEYQKQCKKYKMTFIDTSYDYHGEIKKFTENVCEYLK